MATTAAVEESLELVRESNREVFNDRKYDRATDYQSEDIVLHGPMPGQELRGIEASTENLKMFHAAFSDLEASEEVAFSDGEFVCTLYTYRGTHDGDLIGIPATDVEAEVPGITISRIEDGKIVEGWVVVDFLSLFQQLGLVPAVDEMAA